MASKYANMLPKLNATTIQRSLAGSLVAVLIYLVGCHLTSPLRRYPGPFLAKFTNIWRLYRTTRKSFHGELQELHRQYGPIVRVAPNILDVDYPELIKTVFSTKGDWKKTEFYHPSSALVDGHIVYNLFSERDVDVHAAQKKPIAKFYSPNGVAPLEPLVDQMIDYLCAQLDKRFATGKPTGKAFNLGDWMLYFAWDVVGTVTFSQPIGYLEKGTDFDGTLRTAEKAIDYFSLAACLPALDLWLDKNPIMHIGPPGFSGVVNLSVKHLVGRYQGTDTTHHSASQSDYLDHFIEAKTQNPTTVNDNQIVSWLMINLIAGADTTASTIRSALYYSLRTPGVWTRLQDELATAGCTPDQCPLPYKSLRALPYLEAVIHEALRYLPGVSLSLERYVPEAGQGLPDGSFVPGGSILAFNPYVICRNKDVFGEDADDFRPERWLQGDKEGDKAYAERLRLMNNADLSFGAGSRICIGKHLALMQVYKVVATLVVLYDVELDKPEKEWKVIVSWFARQEGLIARMRRRE